MNLKKMDSPLSKKKISIAHMYERYDNDEILEKLNKAEEELSQALETSERTFEAWNIFIDLYNESDSITIVETMKKFKKVWDTIKDTEIQQSFFEFDDATRGLVKKNITIKVNKNEVFNKLFDLIIRTLLKCVDNYRKSEEKMLIEKAFERMKEIKIGEKDLKLLLGVKVLLETESSQTSLETSYKKFGEMHANINQKLFEIEGLKYLRKYFTEETIFYVDVVFEEFEKLHKKFLKDECVFVEHKKLIERNISELEIYYQIIAELLLETEPGKEFFHLSSKLYTINNYIASKYYILDEKDLYKCLNILADDSFVHFISVLESLMFALRNELKNNQDVVDIEDLIKVGVTTGKTTMITTYTKAIEEILASLGTFMGNTLHSLVKEMLQNLPEDNIRQKIMVTYERIESYLREFDMSDSI